jgi:hypothetical protein
MKNKEANDLKQKDKRINEVKNKNLKTKNNHKYLN